MKTRSTNKSREFSAGASSAKPKINNIRRNIMIILLIAVVSVMIAWIYGMSKKVDETVTVAVYAYPIYKNQQITEDMFIPYEMQKIEYEKYALYKINGVEYRRLALWEEIPSLVGLYAAYPIKKETYVDFRDLTTAKIDNSDTILKSYPGRQIVIMQIQAGDLNAFKTFLGVGERLNITGVYKEEIEIQVIKGEEVVTETVDTFRTDTSFMDIMIADVLNSRGESVLDILESYKLQDINTQAALDRDTDFQRSLEPSNLLLALTTEELERYYFLLNKTDITFMASLPQKH